MTEAKPPDVTGWLLEEAEKLLLAAGWTIESINISLVPQGVQGVYEGDGFLRVARQRVVGDCRVALVVVRECHRRV